MSQKYQKRTARSRRKSPVTFCSEVVGQDGASVQLRLPVAEILAGVQDAVEAVAAEAGLLVMKTLIEEEVEARAGPRYRHRPERQASRWGAEEGSVVFAGRKVPLARPRLRSRDGHEVPLERYELFRGDGRLQRAVTPRVLAGVAMRDYEGTLDAVCDGYGVQRSSVSRHWKAVSAARLREFLERPLGTLDLAVLMIDGIEFHDFLLVVALGLDSQGKKHVLGLWPGATENATVCKELLADLLARGLATDRKYLVVIDGSKALAKAVRATFGDQAEVQRCQVHKERNVLEQLPPEHQGRVRQRLRVAWNLKSHADAEAALQKLVAELEAFSPAAASSLREGLEETLTVHRLGVPEKLRQTLRSTNPIESCFSATRKHCRNVKRWRSGEMVQRWVGTMLLEVEGRFRRVRGHREMPLLVAALRPRSASESSAA
jgi:transposase-like protein